ncbi:unnamed protein product [Dibothriocephalus latus]|uniref:EGF-like domain-containing protein n=1 Tax=Dibothriocephalus latus TaxID=60516 RepID=A0A3P7LJQ7_DIBLA|nr:unnamed protein product [Dibothriocephalus latus]
MLESACVFHIADLSPNEFFMQRYDDIIKRELSRALLRTSASNEAQLESNVYLLSVQATLNSESAGSVRPKRSSAVSSPPRGVDVLLSIYDPLERQFIESGHLVQRIHAMQSNLSGVLRHSVHAYNSLCAQKKCESGNCVTRIMLDIEDAEANVFEVHGVSRVSPPFRLVSTCRCPLNFGGPACGQPRTVCGTVTCKSPRICVPPWTPGTSHACVCPPPWKGENCELLSRPVADPKACFSDTCYQQRGKSTFDLTFN